MQSLERKDYYGVLRLPYGASDAVIRQRYRRLAKRLHPDVNPALSAPDDFRAIREAHDVLLNPALRPIIDSWYASSPSRTLRPRDTSTARPPSGSAPNGSSPPPVRPGRPHTPSPVWAAGSDTAWAFGCFSLLTFFVVFVGLLSTFTQPSTALPLAVILAIAVGVIAARGGDRARETILWLLSWL
jgi:curved DNA-binding protein CbpA